MMESYCYIIFSPKLGRFYTGACREDLPGRILHHNTHLYGNHRFTAAASDWELFLAIPVKDYSHAIRLERLIKAMKSAKYIRNLKKYPELVEKIVNETSKDSPESFRGSRSQVQALVGPPRLKRLHVQPLFH